MSNFREMLRKGSRMAVRKNLKFLKYEHIIYIYIYINSFEVSGDFEYVITSAKYLDFATLSTL